MIGTPPTETSTRAFNANNVASVYISSGYGDLVTKSEQGGGDTTVFDDAALSLQNGIYGMSDPANLKGMVERFEVELTQGGTSKGTYRLRLLNPTAELELFLFGIYNATFPNTKTPFEMYANAALADEAKETVLAVEESTPLKDLLSRGMQLPFLYLRWGYGTKQEEGLSRIHKCVLFGCEYFINNNKDKVIELHLIDWFSSLAENKTFNIAPHLTEESCLDGEKQLRPFTEILGSLILKYAKVYPGVYTLFDYEAMNLVNLDTIASNLAVRDYGRYTRYVRKNPGDADKFVPGSDLQGNTVEEIDSSRTISLGRKLPQGKDFSSPDELTPLNMIWLAAYSKVFKFLGINQRHTSETLNIDPVTVENLDFNPPDSRSALGVAFNKYKKDVFIKTTEIGMLDFMLPVWEAPEVKSTWIAQDPTLMVAAKPKLQPFLTSRTINLNPNLVMQAEMSKDNPLTPTVYGPFVKGYLSATQNANTFDAVGTGREVTQIGAYKISFADFETIIIGIRKLLPDLLSFEKIELLGKKSESLPNAVITNTTLGLSQPNYTTNEADFLLYSPLVAGTSVESLFVGSLPPHELRSFGTFQTKGAITTNPFFPVSPNETTAGNNPSIEKASPIRNFTIKHSISSQYTPIIRLVPSPQAIATLEAKFLQLQIDTLAGAKEIVDNEAFAAGAAAHRAGATGSAAADLSREYRETALEVPNNQRHTVTASLGTGNSTTPHITGILKTVIAAINKLVVGEEDPFIIQQVDLNSLSPENFTQLFEPTGLLHNEKDSVSMERWLQKPTLLLIGRSKWLATSFSDRLTSKIYSFPEITRTEPNLQDYIFLTYGQKDSIVTDLKFTGDIRTLYNIPRAVYATKQYDDLNHFFKTTDQEEVFDIITDLIVFIHENEYAAELSVIKDSITELRASSASEADILTQTRRRDQILKERVELKNITALNYETYKPYLENFPSLVTSFTEDQLTDAGFTDHIAARKVASVLGTKEFKDLLFPVQKDAEGKEVLDSEGALIRQLDVAEFQTSLAGLESASMDAKMNYVRNSQDESWQVEIATLGIPEIDVQGAEFFSRRVVLTVNSPRGGKSSSGEEGFHWLSGVYAIAGIKHVLDPSAGFITNLSLIKIPAAALPDYA